MAFVPGFEHDVFISYAHGDDRDWINRFLGRLEPDLARLLPGAKTWIDKDDLRKSRNFTLEIPTNLDSSAILISLISPTYIRRPYCVQQECRRFVNLTASRKRDRFSAPQFATEQFGFRCPILPLTGTLQTTSLIPGVTDIPFCDDISTFPISSPSFEKSFFGLLRELRDLLIRMRNHCTPVILYPRSPTPEITEAHSVLTNELSAKGYLILPEDEVDDPIRHVSRSELAVLLLGASYDQSETPRRLAEEVRKFDKPFVIWPSPAVENAGDLAQRGLLKELRNLECARKTLLSPIITPEKLTDEAKAILHNKIPPAEDGKPRVYLVYDSQQNSEAENAGQIALNYAHEFYFEHSDNPRLHTGYLTQSDGVLLVWGDAAEEWCSTEFDLMVRLSNQPKARGLCLFDPKQPKLALAKQIRSEHPNICVAEQFGKFDKAGLDPFFAPLRRSQGATA